MSLQRMFTTPVTVTPYAGESAYGPTYGAVQTISVRVNESRRLVRNAAGDEVVSETTLYGPISAAAAFAPESLVTVNGRQSRVLNLSERRVPGGGSSDHVEVTLT